MKKTLHHIGRFFRVAFWLVLLYLLSLFFHQQELPSSLVARICDELSSTNIVVHCEGISVGIRHGLQIRALRVLDTTRHDPLVPLCAAASVSVSPFERRVRVVDAWFPRLGDPYYDGTADYSSGPVTCPLRLPDLSEFELELERGNILGVAPETVTAAVKVSPTGISFRRVHLVWPDQDRRMELDAWCDVDLAHQRVRADIRGEATQAQIRPLLVALDVPVAYPYMDAFTHVQGPVRATCAIDVDISEPGFKIDLDLHPVMGRYNGVSMRKADGRLSLDIHLPNGNFEYLVTVGPIRAFDRGNGELSGTVQIQKTNEVFHVGFAADSSLPFQDALDVMGYFNDGLLDCITCETSPRFSVAGTYYPYVPHTKETLLEGRFSVMRGSVLGLKLFDVSSDWGMVGETLVFSNAVAHGREGGSIYGSAEINIPELDGDRAEMHLDLKYGNGTVPELAEFFGIDAESRNGRAEGRADIRFPLSSNALSRLNGRVNLTISDGRVMQTKLFAGLTQLLAERVPGIGTVVNQTDCTGEGEIIDGVLHVTNLQIEGTVFSIVASGTCNLVTGELDFLCRLTFMRSENLVGKVLSPIFWTVSKMLMEVKVGGTLQAPEWNYLGLFDRIQGK